VSVPAYERYRDSGVEWLGEVPSHWGVRRLKHIADVYPSNVDKKSQEGEIAVRLCNYTDVYYNDVILDDPDFMVATATKDQIDKFTLRAGDTIITKDSETADDIAISAFVPRDLPGIVCGYHLSMVRPISGTSGAFIKRYFDSAFAKASFAVRANGLTRVGLGQYAVDNVEVPFPSLPEQTAIATFLDRETAKIDALMEEQRRLIGLLKEKRQAVISHAVTKGLDPSVPMKDSGVEWLGEVPAHWTTCGLGFRYDVSLGKMLDEKRETGKLPSPYLRNTDVQWGKINIENLPEMDFSGDEIVRYGLVYGDLMVCEGGEVGRAAIWQGDLDRCFYQKALHRLRPHSSASEFPPFMYYILSAAAGLGVFSSATSKATIAHLPAESFRKYRFGFPPFSDQVKIANFLDQQTFKIDALVAEALSAELLLQERRSALISAAVTGKIDVRGLVASETEAA